MKFQTKLDNESLLIAESVLSTANGYIGVKANFEEGYGQDMKSVRRTYIKAEQKMLDAIDGQTIMIYINGIKFDISTGTILMMERQLNIEKGVAERRILWESPKGHQLELTIRRMTSFELRELFMIDYKIRSIGFEGDLKIVSTLDGNIRSHMAEGDGKKTPGSERLPDIEEIHAESKIAAVEASVKGSDLRMACLMYHDMAVDHIQTDSGIMAVHERKLRKHATFRFTKYVIYTDNLRYDSCYETGIRLMEEAVRRGRDHWYSVQKRCLNEFWSSTKIDVSGDEESQEAIDYSCYQILASTGEDPMICPEIMKNQLLKDETATDEVTTEAMQDADVRFKSFIRSTQMDLDGFHLENACRVYREVIHGFGGLSFKDDCIHLNPRMPEEWKSLTFRLNHKGKQLKITIDDKINIEYDGRIRLCVFGREYEFNYWKQLPLSTESV